MGERVQVVIVEDDPDVGLLILDVLASHGITARLVRHPGEIPPELDAAVVMSDLFGPPWYDRAAAEALVMSLRERFPSAPLVLVTAFAEAARDHALIGIDAVVTKPFDVDALSRTVLTLARATPTFVEEA